MQKSSNLQLVDRLVVKLHVRILLASWAVRAATAEALDNPAATPQRFENVSKASPTTAIAKQSYNTLRRLRSTACPPSTV